MVVRGPHCVKDFSKLFLDESVACATLFVVILHNRSLSQLCSVHDRANRSERAVPLWGQNHREAEVMCKLSLVPDCCVLTFVANTHPVVLPRPTPTYCRSSSQDGLRPPSPASRIISGSPLPLSWFLPSAPVVCRLGSHDPTSRCTTSQVAFPRASTMELRVNKANDVLHAGLSHAEHYLLGEWGPTAAISTVCQH